MSKANTIRKKALECARRQDWESAIREYRRLAEIDQANPNIYNELGDIFLKVGDKTEAYDSFAKAIDGYVRVSLYNNAVAVCKKVLRIIPARYEVHAKLGCIRKKQGLAKEAESYCLQYLDRLSADANADPKKIAQTAETIAESMSDCAVVLDRLAERLFNAGLDLDAAKVLARLFVLYDAEGLVDARGEVRKRIEALGMAHLIESKDKKEPAKQGPVITEENIWTDSLSEGERISVEGAPRVEPGATKMGSHAPHGPDETVHDFRTVNLPNGDTAVAPPATPANPAKPVGRSQRADDGADLIHVSSIIDGAQEGAPGVEQDDYRSHYDLGMAYLEMNLFDDAVREYQLAAKAPEFQVKSLEMIGLCFLRQNQAHLAIKQLSKGLSQIDENDADALGIKYNLGLAYEMAGDDERAQALFEDVYVVDVSFREVAQKVARYSKK